MDNKKPEDITVEDVVRHVGPTDDWFGECIQVCVELVGVTDSHFMQGELVLGTWLGPDPPKRGYWRSRALKEDRPHAWVLLPDGRIFDPTRWCLELAEPYIWIGANDGCYEGEPTEEEAV